jgi:hypothetical protein
VLKFWCAEKDGLYLKSLLLHAWASTKLQGQFIPAKAWLLTSRDAYRNLLRIHNAYIEETTVITIERIHPTVANKSITVASKTMSIKEYILQKTQLIESMERTSNSEEKGKWFFIVKKSNTAAASNFLNIELKNLYHRVVPNNLKFDTVPIPRRAKSRAAKAVGSYAEILMGLTNSQDDLTGYNTNPIRPRKRAAVDIKMSIEETPKDANPTTGKQSNNATSINNMVTMEMLEQKLSNFCKEMEAMQIKKLEEMKSQLDEQLTTKITEIMNKTVTKMQEGMKLMMETNAAATSNMIKASINNALQNTQQGKSGPYKSALGLGRIKQSSASNAAEK